LLFFFIILLFFNKKANGNDANAFALLGLLYSERGDSDRARRSHAKAFELDGCQTDSALFLSDILMVEDAVSAARLHAAVLRSSPMCKWAAQRLGMYLLSQKRPDDALGAFQSMIRAAPEDPVGWEGLADSYRAQGKFMASLQVRIFLFFALLFLKNK
jgi:predicted Zn-dependent protease